MGQSRPLFVYSCSFHIPISMTYTQFEQYKLKKSSWSAWNSNPGWQDGRCRRNPLSYGGTHLKIANEIGSCTNIFKEPFENDVAFEETTLMHCS